MVSYGGPFRHRGITMGCTRSRGSRGFQCLASSPRPGEPGRYPARWEFQLIAERVEHAFLHPEVVMKKDIFLLRLPYYLIAYIGCSVGLLLIVWFQLILLLWTFFIALGIATVVARWYGYSQDATGLQFWCHHLVCVGFFAVLVNWAIITFLRF